VTQHCWLGAASAFAVAAACAAGVAQATPSTATATQAKPPGATATSNAAAIAALKSDVDAQFTAVLAAIAKLPQSTTPTPPTCPAGGPLTTVTIGPSQTFTEMAYAIPCMAPGFTMTVLSGTADLVPFDIPATLSGWTILGQADGQESINGQGGIAAGHRLAWGKGCIHAQSPGRVYGIVLKNCGGAASGGGGSGESGIYAENFSAPGTLVIDHVLIENSDDGVFSPSYQLSVFNGPGQNVTLDIESCDFVNNGQSQDGLSHDIYATGAALIVNNSNFYGNPYGNQIKTRTLTTTVTGGYNANIAGGRWIDAANGGVVTVTGGVYDVPASTPGENVIGFGEEGIVPTTNSMSWSGAHLYVGRFDTGLEVATGENVAFDGTNTLTWTASGATIAVSGGGTMTGLPTSPPVGTVFGSDPTPPAHVSGAP
jgi:hypothetical protein